jgi:hypothetical protein
MNADFWYDTHSWQKDYLNNNLRVLSTETEKFFNKVKNKQDVTILIFSEFWRTIALNETQWTDHWMAWWMFIISNNQNIKTNLPNKMYWNNSFINETSDWLTVWIDYRTIYSTLIKSLWNKDINTDLWWDFNIDNYTDNIAPKIELFRPEFEKNINANNNFSYTRLKFKINDKNYFQNETSYLKLEYWTNPNSLIETARYNIERYMTLGKNWVILNIWNLPKNTKYYYKVTVFDNQYNKSIISWDFITPDIKALWNTIIWTWATTRFLKYENQLVNWNFKLENWTSSWITLSNSWVTEFVWKDNIKLISYTWTYITDLTSSWWTWSIWNWTFTLPENINKDNFLSTNATFKTEKLENLKIWKIIKMMKKNLLII